MQPTVFHIFFAFLALLHSVARATNEPIGRLQLLSVYVNDVSQDHTDFKDSMKIYLKCSTQSQVSKVSFKIYAIPGRKRLIFREGEDLKISLLSHESVECELLEISNDDEEESHGLCEYTYARFLAPDNNIVMCNLGDGSSFMLRLACEDSCPAPVPPPNAPYCRKSKKLQAVDVGKSNSFNDGSPGFALYAPQSNCSWTIPRIKEGTTNFLFSRLDLGSGDVIEAYSSADGETETLIKKYTSESVPESVATSEKFLILKFLSDKKDEGLGFSGFYYYTAEKTDPVAIVPAKKKTDSAAESTNNDTEKSATGARKDL